MSRGLSRTASMTGIIKNNRAAEVKVKEETPDEEEEVDAPEEEKATEESGVSRPRDIAKQAALLAIDALSEIVETGRIVVVKIKPDLKEKFP
eukprot:CAMPEP_0204884962 /NCGR_PEP_ID=MMETSP1349-20130617/11263_1 /ASSEMBLY_ACC=CAM_ASM_000710 /TAXON_ID=215587 /ORGANISM="Aplanochytrium stocchinoi, Strain GSBS06" /LENGTH=91 /DNA_ID=CAMNT_0052046129 /DNA_START=64 /DNA_END=336 /DNA_ORIENTATION=-